MDLRAETDTERPASWLIKKHISLNPLELHLCLVTHRTTIWRGVPSLLMPFFSLSFKSSPLLPSNDLFFNQLYSPLLFPMHFVFFVNRHIHFFLYIPTLFSLLVSCMPLLCHNFINLVFFFFPLTSFLALRHLSSSQDSSP